MVDWTISLGNILTVLSILFFGSGFYWKQLIDSKIFKEDIVEIKSDLKILNKVITDLAIQSSRLDSHVERLNRMDRRMDDFSHGRGFIVKENHE